MVFPWERAVRMRLGKHVRLLEPGLHLRVPYADEFVVVNTRLRIAATPRQTLTTADDTTITVSLVIGFSVVDPLLAFRKFETPTGTVRGLAVSALSDYVTKSRKPEAVDETSMTAAVIGRLRAVAPGLEFEFVSVQDLAVLRVFRLVGDGNDGVGVWGDGNDMTKRGAQGY